MIKDDLRAYLIEYCPIAYQDGVFHIEGASKHSIDCYACPVENFVEFVCDKDTGK